MSQEPKSRSPRIEIKPDVWPALQVEAITRRMSPKDLVNMLIMESLSPMAREFMESKPHDTVISQPIATKEPMSPSPHEPMRRAATVADISQKRKRLADNPSALQQIKTLWAEGVHNGTEIAKRINYPKATVAEHIKKMRDKGELK
jgi:hypothetical protein